MKGHPISEICHLEIANLVAHCLVSAPGRQEDVKGTPELQEIVEYPRHEVRSRKIPVGSRREVRQPPLRPNPAVLALAPIGKQHKDSRIVQMKLVRVRHGGPPDGQPLLTVAYTVHQ